MSKTVSPHIQFYTSFGRPIAKVFLGAMCTYQAAYWLWTKLETEEVKREKVGTLQHETRHDKNGGAAEGKENIGNRKSIKEKGRWKDQKIIIAYDSLGTIRALEGELKGVLEEKATKKKG